MPNSLLLPLRDVLKRHYESRGQSWNALALAIAEANKPNPNAPPQWKVDRRKLQQLCSDNYEKVSLTIAELKAIDQFLLRYNEGLAETPIFKRCHDLLDAFLGSDQLHFFIAVKTYPELDTQVLSRWDLRAITRVIRSKVNRLDLKLWDIETIGDWNQSRQLAMNQAKIAVGSPIASVASEALLAEMLDVTPSQPDKQQELPFFLIRRDQDADFKSAFIFNRQKAGERLNLPPEQIPSNRRSIVIGSEIFTPTTPTEDFGLLVAQRHPKENQLHLVLCGLTGPATYGLAKALQEGMMQAMLPDSFDDRHPPILAALFRVSFELAPQQGSSPQAKGETRRCPKPKLVPPLRVFYHTAGKWQERE